jgi:hypothetical protein
MNEDKPYDLPPALTVADLCAQQAWENNIDDESRLRLEMAADTIRALHRRLMQIAKSLETTEAHATEMAKYIRSMSGQKGGAA